MISGTACFLGIVITIFRSLYPSEKFSKQMKMIFSLIFIISVVRPFASGKISFPEINENISANIQTSINISENGSISINEVKLVLDDLNLLPDAEECIRNAAESNVTVTAELVPEIPDADISAE